MSSNQDTQGQDDDQVAGQGFQEINSDTAEYDLITYQYERDEETGLVLQGDDWALEYSTNLGQTATSAPTNSTDSAIFVEFLDRLEEIQTDAGLQAATGDIRRRSVTETPDETTDQEMQTDNSELHPDLRNAIRRGAVLVAGTALLTLASIAGVWYGFAQNSLSVGVLGVFLLVLVLFHLWRIKRLGFE